MFVAWYIATLSPAVQDTTCLVHTSGDASCHSITHRIMLNQICCSITMSFPQVSRLLSRAIVDELLWQESMDHQVDC